ncbi:hypothetical protein LC612_43065 [Nostoc sp. CHAB 5834]|nr:hypothetical protein [Nostoc sp. CHAB 5834]
MTKQPIELANVQMQNGNKIINSTKQGVIYVERKDLGTYITISCVGYAKKRYYLDPDKDSFVILLRQSVHTLSTVTVKSIKADSIVRLAFKHLADNIYYPATYNLYKLHEIVKRNDTCLYEGTALMKLYSVSALDNISNNQVKLLKHETTINDSLTIFDLNLVNSPYSVIAYDLIKVKPDFMKGKNKNIKYIHEDTLTYNGDKVHKISFYSALYKGFMYIEGTNYNFVKIEFDVLSNKPFSTKRNYKKICQKVSIQYKKIHSKLFLESGQISIRARKKSNLPVLDINCYFSLDNVIISNVSPFSGLEVAPSKPLFKL